MPWSKDYNLFSIKKGNRKIRDVKVRKLIQDISVKNRIKDFPILVNEKMEIIDGQHRFFALQALQYPVFYNLAEEDYEIEEIARLNEKQDKWTAIDFLESGAESKKPDYIRMLSDTRKFNMGPSTLAYILERHTNLHKIKNGSLQYSELDSEIVNYFMDRLEALFGRLPKWHKEHRFIRALAWLINKPWYDEKVFTQQARKYIHKLNKKQGWFPYYISLVKMANHGRPKEEHWIIDQVDFEMMADT